MATKRVQVGETTRVRNGKTEKVASHVREMNVPDSAVASDSAAAATGASAVADPMSESRRPIEPEQRLEMARQIGKMNVMAISGGRIRPRPYGIELPVAHGYHVAVDLEPNDTYTVRRLFRRGKKEWEKGKQENVYFDEVGEQAYRASCYHHEWKDGELD